MRNHASELKLVPLCTTQAHLDYKTQTWTKETLVDHSGEPWFRAYLAEHIASRGMFIIPHHMPLEELILFPVQDQYILSSHLVVGDLPSIYLRQVVHLSTSGCNSCFHTQAVARIESIQEDLARDENSQPWKGMHIAYEEILAASMTTSTYQ